MQVVVGQGEARMYDAAQHSQLAPEVFTSPRLADYMEHVRGGIVFYLRPHRELLADDGVRERSDWEEVLRIDGMVKLMLEMFAVPYVPVASLSITGDSLERWLLDAGVEPATEGDRDGATPE